MEKSFVKTKRKIRKIQKKPIFRFFLIVVWYNFNDKYKQ